MAIEFSCVECNNMLRVGDENAGKTAKCPACETLMQVPGESATAGTGSEKPAEPTKPQAGSSPFSTPPPNPYASPTSDFKAAKAPTTAVEIQPRYVDFGEIWNVAWRVWQENLGLLVGVTVVVVIIGVAVTSIAQQLGHVGSVLEFVVNVFLGIGETQICLKLARGQRAEFADLFGGGPRFLQALVISIILAIAFTLGFLACIVPAVILLLMWWPTSFLVIDEKCDAMDSFGLAMQISNDNWGIAFVLLLVSILLLILGVLAFCLGILLAAPLVSMLWAVAYLMMSGQLITDR